MYCQENGAHDDCKMLLCCLNRKFNVLHTTSFGTKYPFCLFVSMDVNKLIIKHSVVAHFTNYLCKNSTFLTTKII